MPFEQQAMLILLTFLLPIGCFFLWANQRDRRVRGTGEMVGVRHTGAFRASTPLDGEADAGVLLTRALGDLDQEGLRVAIRDAVEARGISQLAQETGLPHGEIEDALAPGGRPPYDTVVTLLRALGYQVRVEPLQSGRRSPVA